MQSTTEIPDQTELERDDELIPDERLRLIFICCHPAISLDARAALTLRVVCGLTTLEIARAFLVSETTMAQRLTRAKAKIADAGIPYEVPAAPFWSERLDAVLDTMEIAYAKAHEDAAASGTHAHFAGDMLSLTQTLVQLMPEEAEPAALAALVRFAEARRPARVDAGGLMIPLSAQDPRLWTRPLIDQANEYLNRAVEIDRNQGRVILAQIHAAWCSRHTLQEPAPWPQVLALYDGLLFRRNDPVVRLNRIVAIAEVKGVRAALSELESLDPKSLEEFIPYHAVRADLLRRAGQSSAAREAYGAAIALLSAGAERNWLIQQRNSITG